MSLTPLTGRYEPLDLHQGFCSRLVSLLDAFEKTSLPRRRPNTMNNYGLILNEIGMGAFSQGLLEGVVAPMARKLFEREVFSLR